MRRCLAAAMVATVAAPAPLLACATCFGKSDSDLAKGMNWGIVSLLAVVIFVPGGIASFFFYLGRRAAALSRNEAIAAREQSLRPALSNDEHT